MEQHANNIALFLVPIITSLLITLGLSLLAFSRRRVIGALPFAIILLLESQWIGGYIIELLSPTLKAKIFWENFQYFGTLLGPWMILVFAFVYVEHKPAFSWKIWAGLALPALVIIFLSFTNPWHHLALLNQRLIPGEPFSYYAYDYGIVVYAVLIFCYILMFWAIYLLVKHYSHQKGIYRRQTGFILAGIILPVVSSFTIFLNIPFLPQRDIAPYYFAIANLFTAYGLFRLGVFEIVPIGRGLVVSNMRDGLLIADASGRLVDINQAARTLMGQPDLIARGQPISSLPGKWSDHFKMDPLSEESHLEEFTITDEKSVQYYEMTVTAIINHHSQFAGQMMLLRNVTKRKKAELDLQAAYNEMEQRVVERTQELFESEARYQAIFEQSKDGFVLVNNKGSIIDANPAFEKITARSCTDLIGRDVWDMVHELTGRDETAKTAESLFWKEINDPASDKFEQPLEVAITTEVGQEKVIQLLAFPVFMGKNIRVGIFIRDITTLKQVQADLLKLNNELENRVAERTAELERVNKELESFSYTISHDLRAPLRSVSGFAAVLQDAIGATLTQENLRFLQNIIINAKHMDALINALLNFSRLGRKMLEYRLIQPAEVSRAAWEDVKAEGGSRTISLQIDELPACMADPILLKQVYVNLISNAVKYTRTVPEANIRVGWTDQDGEAVYWVKDNGVGFDMAYAGKLFGIFQRLHRDNEFEGNGVGLSTVQRIVSRHGGRIWAVAYPNQGATFYFTLGKNRAQLIVGTKK